MKYYRKVLQELITRHAHRDGEIFGIEVGVAAAKTSAYLLGKLPKLKLTLVDRWAPPDSDEPYAKTLDTFALCDKETHEARYNQALERLRPYEDRYRILRQTSVAAAVELPNELFDFGFIDDDHSFEGCLDSMRAYWPKIRDGGLFCGHDHIDPIPGQETDVRGRGVVKACRVFFGDTPYFVAGGGVWWRTK